jgi:hypothetical protein
MPIPYGNGADYAAAALLNLAVYGQGALKNQQPGGVLGTQEVLSTGTHVLTGSFQTLAQVGSITYIAGQKAILTVSVAADVTSSGLSGNLEIQVTDNGVPITTGITQSYPTTGPGVSAMWQVEVSPVGPHVFAVQALAAGDGSLSVAAGHGRIGVINSAV